MVIAPEPSGGFFWTQEPWGPALRSRALAEVADHLFTTRNLPLRGPDAAGGWRALAGALGLAGERIVRVRQVHGASVVEADGAA
ncbi:MAG TPA: hypothetical protein VNK92_07700, partial [Vicinamibacterales bacterium]|nr:hypothetical protein [Vicinamibacterales bacterium]